jgi:hypothetical protein
VLSFMGVWFAEFDKLIPLLKASGILFVVMTFTAQIPLLVSPKSSYKQVRIM